MRKTWEFIKEFSWPFGLFGGIYTIVVRFVSPDTNVSLWALLGAITIFAAITTTLVGYLLRQQPRSHREVLSIEQVLEQGSLFLIKKNDVLGQDMGALIYFREGRYERMVGQGVVETIQTDGMTQLRVGYLDGVEPDLLLRIAQKSDTVKDSIIIRAGIIMHPLQRAEV